MNAAVVARLVLKDLYLSRWIVASALASGVTAVAIMPLGPVWSYVGGVSFVCVLVILNIVLVMHGVIQERRDKVVLFMLSLPVSTREFLAAKVMANAVAFVGPWCVLTAAVVAVVGASPIPDGMVPFLVLVLTYILAYYCVLLAVALLTDSTGWHAATITIGNVSINFLIPLLLGLPSIALHREGPAAVWTRDLVIMLAVQLAIGAAALGLAFRARLRRADFV